MTSIEWTKPPGYTGKTWNIITGCDKLSPGCVHCYAANIAKRFWGDRAFSDVQFHSDRLEQPLKRQVPTCYFVNSMGDLFHEKVTYEQFKRVMSVIAMTPQHIYQVLTKRPERMLEMVNRYISESIVQSVIPFERAFSHLWLGVTVEDQKRANKRITLLLQTPAAVRFLSCEPLLTEIDLTDLVWGDATKRGGESHTNCLSLEGLEPEDDEEFGGNLVDWVIVGGESGPKARPFDIAWARSIIEQCKGAGVPVFMKQLGSNPVQEVGVTGYSMGKEMDAEFEAPFPSTGKGGDPSEWPEDLRVREYPRAIQGRVL